MFSFIESADKSDENEDNDPLDEPEHVEHVLLDEEEPVDEDSELPVMQLDTHELFMDSDENIVDVIMRSSPSAALQKQSS